MMRTYVWMSVFVALLARSVWLQDDHIDLAFYVAAIGIACDAVADCSAIIMSALIERDKIRYRTED